MRLATLRLAAAIAAGAFVPMSPAVAGVTAPVADTDIMFAGQSAVVHVGQRRAPSRVPSGGGMALRGNGGPVEDTCNQSIPGYCDLDELIAACDAAGGGLSTQPGGGVDCDIGPDTTR